MLVILVIEVVGVIGVVGLVSWGMAPVEMGGLMEHGSFL